MSELNNVIDINIEGATKQKFRINGDSTKILELDLSDIKIANRINKFIPKMHKIANKVSKIKFDEAPETDNVDELSEIAVKNEEAMKQIEDLDTELRSMVDELFDSNVSAICAPNGSMCDPINGKFRFEIIIENLLSLYESNIKAEYDLLSQKVAKHTDKYTKR